MIVLLLVYVGAVVSVYEQCLVFLHTPVLMSIDSSPTPVWHLPFPAITVCSENQVRPSFFDFHDFTSEHNITAREYGISHLNVLVVVASFVGTPF